MNNEPERTDGGCTPIVPDNSPGLAVHWDIVGRCDCLTKTPDIKFHAPDCNYRLAVEQIMQEEEARESTHTISREMAQDAGMPEIEGTEIRW